MTEPHEQFPPHEQYPPRDQYPPYEQYGARDQYPPHDQYAPAAYGQPYPMVPREHPQGTTILVLGILGFFVAGICAPFAWYLGSKALREIRSSGVPYSNTQSIVVGRILGMIMTILAIVGIVFFLVFAVILIIAAMSTGSR